MIGAPLPVSSWYSRTPSSVVAKAMVSSVSAVEVSFRAAIGAECGAQSTGDLGETVAAGIARTVQIHRHVGRKAAGARGEHQNAVGEEDRLVDRVGHEQHGGALRRPDIEQLELQAAAGLRVQCA